MATKKSLRTCNIISLFPYTDRLDYLAPLSNNVAYALAVEKLIGWELPPRGKAIRVICCEIARISAHLARHWRVCHGCRRNDCVSLHIHGTGEALQSDRAPDRRSFHYLLYPDRWSDAGFTGRVFAALNKFLDEFVPQLDEVDRLLTRNPIFVDRTKDLGVISKEDAIDYGITGPNLRGSGVDYDVRKAKPYFGLPKV